MISEGKRALCRAIVELDVHSRVCGLVDRVNQPGQVEGCQYGVVCQILYPKAEAKVPDPPRYRVVLPGFIGVDPG